jgi:hypothetical protein
VESLTASTGVREHNHRIGATAVGSDKRLEVVIRAVCLRLTRPHLRMPHTDAAENDGSVLHLGKSDGFDLVSIEIDDEGAEIRCHRRRALGGCTFVPGAQRCCLSMEGSYRFPIGGTQANMRAGIAGRRHVMRPAVEPELRISLSKPNRRFPRNQT